MRNQMLSVVTDPALRDELRALFAQYPFAEMPNWFALDTGFTGYTDVDGSIYLRQQDDAGMLAIYLHEVVHASLLRAGHPQARNHTGDFVRLCRELQVRFGVADRAWHAYDQQDAVLKTTAQHSVMRAAGAAMAINYDPTQRALHAAIEAVQAEHRHNWRYVLIVGGAAVAVMAWIMLPWAAWWDAMTIDADAMKLVAGAAVAGWLWWNFRR